MIEVQPIADGSTYAQWSKLEDAPRHFAVGSEEKRCGRNSRENSPYSQVVRRRDDRRGHGYQIDQDRCGEHHRYGIVFDSPPPLCFIVSEQASDQKWHGVRHGGSVNQCSRGSRRHIDWTECFNQRYRDNRGNKQADGERARHRDGCESDHYGPQYVELFFNTQAPRVLDVVWHNVDRRRPVISVGQSPWRSFPADDQANGDDRQVVSWKNSRSSASQEASQRHSRAFFMQENSRDEKSGKNEKYTDREFGNIGREVSADCGVAGQHCQGRGSAQTVKRRNVRFCDDHLQNDNR